jgi:nitroimidazol reductase NimA-like FMN-containing flavoprotein (pyridoxamine 5'-phosphate oxidase superfamily)
MLKEARRLVAIQDESYEKAGGSIRSSWPQRTAMNAQALAGFLERKRYAILATVRPDGRPQAAPVAFHVSGGAFWIATVAGARVRNLQASPHAALVISEGERGNHRAVRVEGSVSLHEDEALAAVRKKLDSAWEERQGSTPEWAAAFIELRPETLYSYDSALVKK